MEYTTTANDREKYATYTRDSVSGLDYAVNRYYSSQWGRFLSADPYMADAGGFGDPKNPHSWNRFAYAQDDPVNGNDPRGLYVCWVAVGEGLEQTQCDLASAPDPEPDSGGSPVGGGPSPCGSKFLQAQYLDIFAEMGKDLNVNPMYIMAVSLQESGWQLVHVYGTNSSSGGNQLK